MATKIEITFSTVFSYENTLKTELEYSTAMQENDVVDLVKRVCNTNNISAYTLVHNCEGVYQSHSEDSYTLIIISECPTDIKYSKIIAKQLRRVFQQDCVLYTTQDIHAELVFN